MYTLSHLFQQLGLPHDDNDIARFVVGHKMTKQATPLPEAPFWSQSQAAFIRECWGDDSDWSQPVDELDALLRR